MSNYTETIEMYSEKRDDTVTLEVEFHYYRGRAQTMIDPAEEEEWEILSVSCDGQLLEDDDIEWSDDELVEAIKDQCGGE